MISFKSHCLVACLVAVFVPSPLPAASLYGDRLASGNPAGLIEGDFQAGKIRIAPLGGVNALFIDNAKASLKTVPVTPKTKYTLSFDGAFTGPIESIEENPRFELFTRPGRKSPVLPMRHIRFFDAAGKAIGQPLVFSMPFREEHTYVDVFYTPREAAGLRLDIASGDGATFSLRNLTLEKTADEGAINVNPAFALGPFNYSGWRRISAGGKIIQLDGKTIFDTKYGSRSMAFPLQGPGTYALSAKATGNGFNSCVQVHLFDAKGNVLLKVTTRRYGPRSYFVPPKGAVTASFLVYSCLLEEVRLVRVGDENAIDKLTK